MVVRRPVADVANICLRIPDLWRAACADASHNCLPLVILNSDSPEEVAVPLVGGSVTLPNIHPQLLLLAQLQPGMRRRVLRAMGCGVVK